MNELALLSRERGYHGFYGVDNHCFKIGKTVFEALEDESDGYRSYLQSVVVRDPKGLIFFKRPIAKVKVVCHDNEEENYSLVDETGYVWLTIGTDYTDDYYPFFVFDYKPHIEVQS